MKKSVGSFIALNHRAFVLLGAMLGLAVFGFITSQINAKNRALPEQEQDAASVTAALVTASQTAANNGPVKDGNVIVGHSYKNDVSIPLRDMRPEPYLGKPMDREANENPKIPHSHVDVPDEGVQDQDVSITSLLAPTVPSPLLSF